MAGVSKVQPKVDSLIFIICQNADLYIFPFSQSTLAEKVLSHRINLQVIKTCRLIQFLFPSYFISLSTRFISKLDAI